MSITFARIRNGCVKIGDEALKMMREYTQLSHDATEAGGVLIGRHIVGGHDIVVDLVTSPMSGDRRSRTRFDRARRRHQQALDEEWKRSGGTSVYLGEWHTHPEPTPRPSGIDLNDWRRRLHYDSVEAHFLVFFIVGQRAIRGWEGSRTSFGISPLREQRIQQEQRASNG